MVHVDLVDVEGIKVKTTLANTDVEVDDQVATFLQNKDGKKVVGLDTEWQLVQDEDTKSETDQYRSEVAILQLCNGDSCAIIQLQQLDSVPVSLFNFLRLPEFTFVGIGIKESIAKLGKQYGIGCKNAVELGPFAASVMGMPHLSACGLGELAYVINSIKLQGQRFSSLVVSKDWGSKFLSKPCIQYATINVYACHRIANKLLGYE